MAPMWITRISRSSAPATTATHVECSPTWTKSWASSMWLISAASAELTMAELSSSASSGSRPAFSIAWIARLTQSLGTAETRSSAPWSFSDITW